MPWRLASAWGDSPPRNSWTTWRLNSIECVRCLAMGFLLESPVQLADSQGRHLSTPRGALHVGASYELTTVDRLSPVFNLAIQHGCPLKSVPRFPTSL